MTKRKKQSKNRANIFLSETVYEKKKKCNCITCKILKFWTKVLEKMPEAKEDDLIITKKTTTLLEVEEEKKIFRNFQVNYYKYTRLCWMI